MREIDRLAAMLGDWGMKKKKVAHGVSLRC